MTLGGIIILLLLLISLIAFIYLVVVTARGWGALHTTLLCFLFIECWVFMVFAAGVQNERVKAIAKAEKEKERAERATSETQRLLWGTFKPGENNLNAVIPVQGELRRQTADRGRVWRGLSMQPGNGGSFDLRVTAQQGGVDPAAPAAGAGPASSASIPVNLVVYAFGEESNAEGMKIPKHYLGEHTVTKSQDGEITVQPTLALSRFQQRLINEGKGDSWTLYESLPLDGHRPFAASGSQESDTEVFGRMDEESIGALFTSVPEANNRRTNILNSYLHDGQRANQDDPEDSIWVSLTMQKTEKFDVDSKQEVNVDVGSFFDSFGRAIDARLKIDDEAAKGTVSLDTNIKNNMILFKASAASSLENSGAAKVVQRFYVRPLNDYEQVFNDHAVRMKDIAERITIYTRETELLNNAYQNIQTIIVQEQKDKVGLDNDLQYYRSEVSVLQNSVNKAQSELASLQTEMTQLFNLIHTSTN
ncbi:MAG: hypothetical protein AAF483_24080 [Planctomycetota bacterium]